MIDPTVRLRKRIFHLDDDDMARMVNNNIEHKKKNQYNLEPWTQQPPRSAINYRVSIKDVENNTLVHQSITMYRPSACPSNLQKETQILWNSVSSSPAGIPYLALLTDSSSRLSVRPEQ
jgi:hypothetical protein